MSNDPKRWSVGLVGYGEVGRILAEDLRAQGVAVAAYDLKLDGATIVLRASRAVGTRPGLAPGRRQLRGGRAISHST